MNIFRLLSSTIDMSHEQKQTQLVTLAKENNVD